MWLLHRNHFIHGKWGFMGQPMRFLIEKQINPK